MKFIHEGWFPGLMALIILGCFSVSPGHAHLSQGSPSTMGSTRFQGTAMPSGSDLIQPSELASLLRSATGAKALILNVGFRVLFAQAHIPDSEYAGPGNSQEGIQRLRKRVESLPRTQSIILYCGCCPWNVCPNISPAYREMLNMGFKNVKALYISTDFGKEWVAKGYPVEKGE